MDRVRLYIPTEALQAGETVVVHGPGDAGGAVDTAKSLRGGRFVPVPLRDGEHLPVGISPGPVEQGPSGEERQARSMLSKPLPFGVHEFAVSVRDRETGELAAGSVQTISVLVNASPPAVRGVRSDEVMIGGKLTVRSGW